MWGLQRCLQRHTGGARVIARNGRRESGASDGVNKLSDKWTAGRVDSTRVERRTVGRGLTECVRGTGGQKKSWRKDLWMIRNEWKLNEERATVIGRNVCVAVYDA